MAKLPVFATVGPVFSDTIRAARAMPVLVIAAAIVSGAHTFSDWALTSDEAGSAGNIAFIKLAVSVAVTILVAPVLIAISRFVVLNEVTGGYALPLSSARFQRFCAWSVALLLLTELLALITPALGIEGDAKTAAEIVLLLVSFAVAVSLTLLFPAIAVDAPGATAPGATLRNSLADLRGAFWRIFAILVLVALPILAVAFSVMWAVEDSIVDLVTRWLAALLLELLWTAASARLFLTLADRLRSPDPARTG
jgi:hypothetical protein